MSAGQAPFLKIPFLERNIDIERRPNGVLVVRNKVPFKPIGPPIPHLLHRAAETRPDHAWLAQRHEVSGAWRRLHYGEAHRQVNALTQALLDLRAPGRPVMVLSGNSIEHAVIELAAMQAGMPYAPITPAYSLLSTDHMKLKSIAALLDPAVVFVQKAAQFSAALRALDLSRATVIQVEDPVAEIASLVWNDLVATPVRADVAQSLERITHDTVAKYLFTSGSTGVPKAVTVTQGMMCASVAMNSQMIETTDGTPEKVVLEWLPWSHVAGGSAIFNGVLDSGGTMYIDGGRPAPGAFQETIRNLKEVAPVSFSSMPIGYAMLLEALERDEDLARSLFRNLRRLTSSGARLPDTVYAGMQAQAVKHTGHKIPFGSAYGSTETSAAVTCVFWPTDRSGLIGLPHPGVELKLLPIDGARYEVRVKSPAVTPGYLGQPQLSAQAFDDEGFFLMGDAATFVDPQQPLEGLAFGGRVAEEFKLQSGVFVQVGSLRVECINALSPLVTDVVVTGADRAEICLLAWLNLNAGRELIGRADASLVDLIASPKVRDAIRAGLTAHNSHSTGSSKRIARVLLLDKPASMDAGEITDKGYVNQRRVLDLRAALVDRLYETPADDSVIQII
jgi:feruloyl-CoA synthase